MKQKRVNTSTFGSKLALLPTICALLCWISIAEAGMNKCVDAAGKISYSDQPCALTGQKPKEIQNKSLTDALTQEDQTTQDIRILATCNHLLKRFSECPFVESPSYTRFINQCHKQGAKSRDRLYAKTSSKNTNDALRSHFDQIERKKQALKNTPCEEVVPSMEKMLQSDLAP